MHAGGVHSVEPCNLSIVSDAIQGGNLDARSHIVDVKGYITFDEALVVLKHSKLTPQLQAAYLDFVISAFVDNAMDQSGTDIENIWKSYVSLACVSLPSH